MDGLHLIQHLKTARYPATGTPLIAFFGDSVTHGAFECIQGEEAGCIFDFDAVYHAVLVREMHRINGWLPVSVLNAGVAGDSAACALARMDRDVIARHPDLCVVNFALNDINDSPELYRASLGEIFDRLTEAGIAAVLLTPNMLNTYVHPETIPMYRDYEAVTAGYQNSGRMDTYVDAARELAAARGIPVADAYRRWKELATEGTDTTACLANYINHPSRPMHRIFAEELLKVLNGI